MNAFLDNDICEDELNHGDCMFDGLDCCGYDHNNDGDYDDSSWYTEIAPGDKSLCIECLCKGIHKLEKSITSLEKKYNIYRRMIEIQVDKLDENDMTLMKLQYD